MPSFRFTWDFEHVEPTMRAIRKGTREGMKKAAEDLLDRGEDAARERIYQTDRIWRKEVYRYGWDKHVEHTSPTKTKGSLTNYAQHARVVDEGRRPGSRAPQVQHIIEWVDDKVESGYINTDTGGGPGGGSAGSKLQGIEWDDSTSDEPAHFPQDKTASELESEWNLDSTYWLKNNHATGRGFTKGDLYAGQRVIAYDEPFDEYLEGQVRTVIGPRVAEVYFPGTGDTATVNTSPTSNTDNIFILAGQSWDTLSDQEKWNAVATQFNRIPIYNQFPDYYKDEISQVYDEWMEQLPGPQPARQMAEILNRVELAGPTENPHVDPSGDYGGVIMRLHYPDAQDTLQRDRGELRTIRHETNHVFNYGMGWNYEPEARSGTYGSVRYWKQNTALPYNYIGQGGPDNWGFDSDAGVAPPRVYMLLKESERLDHHYQPLESFKHHVYEQTVVDGRQSASVQWEPLYDGKPDHVFGQFPAAQKGGYIQVSAEDYNGRKVTFELISDVETDEQGRYVEFRFQTVENKLYLNPDGTFESDRVKYLRYSPPDSSSDDPNVNADAITPEPKLYHDDDFRSEQYREGANRALLRKMVTSEAMGPEEARERYFRNGYSGTNGQETTSRFMEIYMNRGDSQIKEMDAWQAYKHHPDYVYAAQKYLGIQPWFQEAIVNIEGRPWEVILRELRERYEP